MGFELRLLFQSSRNREIQRMTGHFNSCNDFMITDGCTVYINIPDDDTLFQGEGDYQFDIYREMKKENKYVHFITYTMCQIKIDNERKLLVI